MYFVFLSLANSLFLLICRVDLITLVTLLVWACFCCCYRFLNDFLGVWLCLFYILGIIEGTLLFGLLFELIFIGLRLLLHFGRSMCIVNMKLWCFLFKDYSSSYFYKQFDVFMMFEQIDHSNDPNEKIIPKSL